MHKPIPVLYEDGYYIAFDKPSGLLVVPAPNKDKRTLVDIVNKYNPCAGQYALHPCHRLDRDTSGVILFAKGKKNQKRIIDAFRNRSVRKKYIALVRGRLRDKHGTIKSAIRDLDQRRFQRNTRAKLAITRYRVIKARKLFSIVEVYPETGRTNQIRIHFSELGHPLLGERKYAFARDFEVKFKRTSLHASTLQWPHPVYHRTITVDAPLPRDIKDFICSDASPDR